MPIPSIGSTNALFPITLGEVEDNTFTRNVTQTFLSDSAVLASFFHPAANRIFFFGAYPGPLGGPTGEIGQLATHNYIFADATNAIFDAAGSNLAGYNQQADIVQYIGFTDRRFHDTRNTLFDQFKTPAASRVGLSFSADATNAFAFNDHDLGEAAKRVYPASNTFAFTETVIATEFEDVWNTYDFTETLDTVGTDFGAPLGDSGFIKQHVTFRVQGAACPEKEYTPYIGESGDSSYPEVPAAAPTLGQGVLTLTHPRVSPTLTLTLKSPDFGNSDVLRFTKIDRRTRGGDRKIFSDLGWGSTQSFELTVSNICATTATVDEVLAFLNTSLGEEIGLLDWENRQWKGIIVAPESDVTPRVGGHSVRIVFEGELV